MNEKTKKGTQQAVILGVLVLLLVFMGVRMFSAVQGPKKSAKVDKAVATKTAEFDPNKRPSSTNMPRSGDAAGKGIEIGEGDLYLNPNQFKVYALNPPKNPFVQAEEWYSEELNKLPGYPELKNSDYLDQPEAYLPDIPLVEAEEWDEITVDRTIKSEPYEISGTSEDGSVTTSIRLTPRSQAPDRLAWSRATGVPVNALKSPDWKKRYGDVLSGDLVVASKQDGFVADVLGVPGADGVARPAGDLRDDEAGAGNGDALYAVGVSQHGNEASALIRHNGKARLVREGSVIPTHYQVLTIKENGVVVIDLRDGSSNWLPLGAAPATSRSTTRKAKTT